MNLSVTNQFVKKELQAHIYSEALLSNLCRLRSLCEAGVKFCAVVKANAYGHGLTEVVNILRNADVDFFAVAVIGEALRIAGLVKNQSILIFEPIYPGMNAEQIICSAKNGFHCAISSIEAAEYACEILSSTGYRLNLHINVETGMDRFGIEAESAKILIDKIDSVKSLRLAGVFTHFATADEEDLSFAYEQLGIFKQFLAETAINTRKDVIVHAANSAATIKMRQGHFDMVRCGISLYGCSSASEPDSRVKLRPVMKLQAPIIGLKKIPRGSSVSYGRCFIAKRDTTAAVIGIGYTDGYLRCLSNRAKMKVGEVFAPVIGRVCMDSVLLDVTDIPDVLPGQMVTVIDDHPDSPCGAQALANLAKTISNEILTCVRSHIRRIVH